jgi:glycosyltransferase involved in cell wall biosynthesis
MVSRSRIGSARRRLVEALRLRRKWKRCRGIKLGIVLVISFVVPAHNEAELLGRTLIALDASALAFGEAYEVIVVDDSSTDRTPQIAAEHGAAVIHVGCRQIAGARNAGGRAAKGELLFFVDADTMVTEPALRAAVRVLRGGAIGGGACVRFDGDVPPYGSVLERVLRLVSPYVSLAPGCFMYCWRTAFESVGGFDERVYWSEEVWFARRLRGVGRFVVLREWVITSARKLRAHSALEMLGLGALLAWRGRASLGERHRFWYGPRGDASSAKAVSRPPA